MNSSTRRRLLASSALPAVSQLYPFRDNPFAKISCKGASSSTIRIRWDSCAIVNLQQKGRVRA